jgi:hypothetical protein
MYEINVVYLATKVDKLEEVKTILKELARYSIADGDIEIKSSAAGSLPEPPASASREAIRDFKKKYRAECQSIFDKALSSLMESPEDIPSFILMVLPCRDIALYSEVKRWGDCVVGIPTVCITSTKLLKVGDPTLRANIWYVYQLNSVILANFCLSLKINSKLKGVSHTISGSMDNKTGGHRGVSGAKLNTIIVGADVTHPKEAQQHSCPSMAGVVATDQDNSSCYLGSARLQKGRQEVSIPDHCPDPL